MSESMHIYCAPRDGHLACIFYVWEGQGRHHPLNICSDSVLRAASNSNEPTRKLSPFLEASLVPARPPPTIVLEIRGGRHSSCQLESLYFDIAPPPYRREQKCYTQVVLKLTSLFKHTFSNSRSVDDSNPCMFRGDRVCVDRIHRKYQVAMGLS